MRAPQLLAIQGNDLPLAQLLHGLNPLYETRLKLFCVQKRKHTPKSVVRWNPMRQLKESLEPVLFGMFKEFDLRPTVGTADSGTNGDNHDVQQLVTFVVIPGIFQGREMLRDRGYRCLLHRAPP